MKDRKMWIAAVVLVAVVGIGFLWSKYGPRIDIQWTPVEEPFKPNPVIDSLTQENAILQDSLRVLARRAAAAGMVRIVNQVRYDTIVITRDTAQLLHSLQLIASVPPLPGR